MSEPDPELAASKSRQQAFRLATCALLGLGMIGFGLVVSGKSTQAMRLLKARSSGFSLKPMRDSHAGPLETISSGGRLELAQYCTTPRSTHEVVAHYEKVAKKARTPGLAMTPYMKTDSQDLGMLAWIDARGRRCGVVAFTQVSNESTRYVLFEGGPAMAAIAKGVDQVSMPLGIDAPQGTEVLFDFGQSKRSMAYYRMPGDPSEILGELRGRLEKAGYQIDRSSNKLMRDMSSDQDLEILPFRKGQTSGYMSLRPGKTPGATVVALFATDQ